ncbi:MAG: hypothetical protein LBN38_00640, partial [Verrucomicrobiota bacterium]|nr:hypothetical protein [Verrucomicrobiota bacterium]
MSRLRPFQSILATASLCIACLLPSPARGDDERAARQAFDAGLQAYGNTLFDAAASNFVAAASTAVERLSPAAAYYNAGLSAYAAGDYSAASDFFARAAAASSDDLSLQAKAYYNRGNALFHLADEPPLPDPTSAPPTPDLNQAKASIGESVQMYENAIALDPEDADAKANYELAVLKQQEIQEQQQSQPDPQKQEREPGDESQESEDSPPEPSPSSDEDTPSPQPQSQPEEADNPEDTQDQAQQD